MIFNSFQFIWLFPIIFIVYWATSCILQNKSYSQRINNILLILISYAIYIQYKPIYALLLLYITLITYLGGIILNREKDNQIRNKYLVTILSILTLFPLLTFKYYNFLNSSLTQACETIGIQIGLPGLNWAIPIGISFLHFKH